MYLWQDIFLNRVYLLQVSQRHLEDSSLQSLRGNLSNRTTLSILRSKGFKVNLLKTSSKAVPPSDEVPKGGSPCQFSRLVLWKI